MKTNQQIFSIYQYTEFGTGVRKIKASDFYDAYRKLNAKEKDKLISICQLDTGDEKWADEFSNYN